MIPVTSGTLNASASSPRYPIFKVEYFDTPYGVPSKGFQFKHYNDPDQDSSETLSSANLAADGRDNILAYDWGVGAPPGVKNTGYFKSIFYGWFHRKYTGEYKFRIIKEPTDYAKFVLRKEADTLANKISDPGDPSQYVGVTQVVSSYDWAPEHSNLEIIDLDIDFNGTRDAFLPFFLLYAQREKSSYLALQYLEPDGVEADEESGVYSDHDSTGQYHGGQIVSGWKPLSAGAAAYDPTWEDGDSAEFMTAIIISGVNNVEHKKESNQSNTFSFSVPLLNVSSTNGLQGFRYDKLSGLYYNDDLGIYIRQGRLVKFYAGYSTSGTAIPATTDYVQKFEGIITDIKTTKTFNDSKIDVTCQDLLYMPIRAINENYPNRLSYPLFGFTESRAANEPNGASRPTTYDAWPVADAVRDLYIKSGVDPTKLWGRKKHLDCNGDEQWGDYLIQGKDIILRRRIKYGNPFQVGADTRSDDDYIWKSNFGDPVYDIIAGFADNYGFVAEANNTGHPTFNSINTSETTIANSGWIVASADWQIKGDISAEGGRYLNAETTGIAVTGGNFIGSKFSIGFVKTNVSTIGTGSEEWSIVSNQFPDDQTWNPDRNVGGYPPLANKNFGYLYGRYYQDFNLYYLRTNIYVTPTENITVSKLTYVSNSDNPHVFYYEHGNNAEIGICADIWFHTVNTSSDEWSLSTTSGLILSDYQRSATPKRLDYNRFENTITFSAQTMTAGNTYRFEFITKEIAGGYVPTQQSNIQDALLFSLENSIVAVHRGATAQIAMRTEYVDGTAGGTPQAYYEHTIDSGFYNGNGYGVYPNVNFESSTTPTRSATVAVYRKNSSDIYVGPIIDPISINLNHYDPNATNALRYPNDGPDSTGINPCVLTIYGSLIGTGIYNGVKTSYGDYMFLITDASSVSDGTKINFIDSYDSDSSLPIWSFDSDKNIKSIGLTESMEDVRNDIIVIGDLIGSVKDNQTNEVVNVNNPTYDYVYSRAVDLSSINNPDALNSVGRKKPFIVYQPSIVDQRHADWFAQTLLFRYNKFKQIPNWNSLGIPFIEPNDFVLINDNTSVGNNQVLPQWVTSYSEKISHNDYSMTFDSTPYEPWTSFKQRSAPRLADFGNNAIINVRMTDTNNLIRGRDNVEYDMFDVYEYEISGMKLRVKYDQVIDGDLIVKVVSKEILGTSSEATVAYLVGQRKDGFEIPEYRGWGTDYELLWDGRDELGGSRKFLSQSVQVSTGEAIITLNDTDYIKDFKEPGFFATSGQYFLRFLVHPRDESIGIQQVDTTNLDYEYNQEIADRLSSTDTEYQQYWELKWGDIPKVNMSVSGYRSSVGRNITYYPNNLFYNDEYDESGPKFLFELDGSTDARRTLYYNVSLDHFWNLGYTFQIRNDAFSLAAGETGALYTHFPVYSVDNTTNWFMAYKAACFGQYRTFVGESDTNQSDIIIPNGSYGMTEDILADDWMYAGLITTKPGTIDMELYTKNNTNWEEWSDSNKIPLRLPELQTIVDEGSRYRVYAWHNTPMKSYSVHDYIPTKVHRFNDNNPIEFYMDVTSPLAGEWTDFLAIPDMQQTEYDSFRRYFALAAYYAGRTTDETERVQFITSHTFQVKTLIWDSTGRIVKDDNQAIARPMGEHSHSGLGGYMKYWHSTMSNREVSDQLLYPISELVVTSHSHADTVVKGSRKPGHPYQMVNENIIYDMTVTGSDLAEDGDFNYGIGFCNISGMPNNNFWTWHGHYLNTNYSSNLQATGIPLHHWRSSETLHWRRYPMAYESARGQHLFYSVPNYDTDSDPAASLGYIALPYSRSDYMLIFDEDFGSSTITSGELLEKIAKAFESNHVHYPIFEGLNDSSDPSGLIKTAEDNDKLRINIYAIPTATPNDVDDEERYAYDYSKITFGKAWIYFSASNDITYSDPWETTYAFESSDSNFTAGRNDNILLSGDFPHIWYKCEKTLPWNSDSGDEDYWMNFLVECGFSFFYGGWIDYGE